MNRGLRHWLTLPLWYPAGGLLSLSPAYLAFSVLFSPIPPTPFPAGRGRFLVDFAGGFAPGTPAAEPIGLCKTDKKLSLRVIPPPPTEAPVRQGQPVPRPVQPWGCKGRSPLHKITYSYPLPTGKGVGGMGAKKNTKDRGGRRQSRQAACRVQQPRAATTGEFFRPEQVPAEVPSMIHSGKVLRGSGDSFKSPPAFFFLHRKKSLQFPEECAIINALQAQPAQEAPQAGKQKERRNPHETVCCSQGRAD